MLGIAVRPLRMRGCKAPNSGPVAEESGATRSSVHRHPLAELRPGDFPIVMAAMHEGAWRRVSEDGYAGFCPASRIVADHSPVLEEEVVGRESRYYGWPVEFFGRWIAESQAAGTETMPVPEIAMYYGVAPTAMSLNAERGPGPFSRRRIGEWLSPLLPHAEAPQRDGAP
jgi:hypothetical protein